MKHTEASARGPLPPERLQAMVDTLENNIFRAIRKSTDNTEASILIQRQPGREAVLQKALGQVFARLNIDTRAIFRNIHKALESEIPDTGQHRILRFKVSGGRAKDRRRTLEILVSSGKLLIKIKGAPPREGKNGALVRIYFNHRNTPGKPLEDGKIDFRELNSFPSVKQGQDLMRLACAKPSHDGVTFAGDPIPAPEVREYALRLKEGVTRVDLPDAGEPPGEYLVRAARDGVVIAGKESGAIDAIDVNDTLSLGRIDFSVGNIGSEVECPVSMRVGLIQRGFRVKVNGEVRVQDLDGGIVETTSDAIFDQIQRDSEVRASGNIQTNTVVQSSLNSEQGEITIKKELRDSSLTAAKVSIRNSKGMYANVDVDAEHVDIQNVSVGGRNTVNLGKHLFERRERLLAERTTTEEKIAENDAAAHRIKEELLGKLKKLSDRIGDAEGSLREHFRTLIEALRLSTFEDAYAALNTLSRKLAPAAVEKARKSFRLLEHHGKRAEPVAERAARIEEELSETISRINGITFEIKATLKSTASIEILCHDQEPIVILPDRNLPEEFIHYTGHYNLKAGLSVQKR